MKKQKMNMKESRKTDFILTLKLVKLFTDKGASKMKDETKLTDEDLDHAISQAKNYSYVLSGNKYLTALLSLKAERAKVKDDVWKDADYAETKYFSKMCVTKEGQKGFRQFSRELPKTRAREIAEEMYEKIYRPELEQIENKESIICKMTAILEYAESIKKE
jgi:hypothetical protein